MMCLKVQDIPRRQVGAEEAVRVPRRLNWKKAEKEQLNMYRTELQMRLEELEEPDCLQCIDVKCQDISHSEVRDRYVLDVMSSWVEASYVSIPTAPPTRPSGSKQKKERLPGWNENCEPLCSKAKFWYAVWLSAGRPSTGELHRLWDPLGPPGGVPRGVPEDSRASQRDPEEELRSVFKRKVARNNGLKNDFFQFLT